jgi:hypothetical protein
VLREADVMIYAIGEYGGGQGLTEEITGPLLLRHLTEETGGRVYQPDPSLAAFRSISLELRDRYVLGFSPTEKTLDAGSIT